MKKYRAILAIVLTVMLLCPLVGCSDKDYTPKNSYDEVYNTPSVSIDVTGDTFKILKINDTHFINGTCDDDVKTLEVLKSALDKIPCDLIVMDGDLVEGYNRKITYNKYQAVSVFAELVEQYNTPWTLAPGNNDGQKGGSNEDLIAFLLQYDHFLAGNERDIDGSMQFFIDLKQDGKLVHSVAVLDSHSRDRSGNYDYIKESQIDWLLKRTDERKVPTSVFFHMPTPAFEKAYKEGEAYSDFPFCDEYSVSNIEKNAEFDEKTADNKYITLLSTGHVHSDNIAYFYNNRYYQLSSLGGFGAIGSDKTAPSYTLTTIDLNQTQTENMYMFEKVAP